jgi:hypothetical protein
MTVHKHNPEIRRINREMRAKDESYKWPVCGRFNATDRAIKQATRIRQMTGEDGDYQQLLENLISDIVNLRV